MKKESKRKLKVFLVLTAFAASLTSIKAATHLMEWDGTHIIGKASNQSFYGQGQKVYIYNNVTDTYNINVLHARLKLRKYEVWGKSTAKVMDQYNMGGKTWTYETGKGSHYDIWFSDGYGDDGGAYANWIDMNGYVY